MRLRLAAVSHLFKTLHIISLSRPALPHSRDPFPMSQPLAMLCRSSSLATFVSPTLCRSLPQMEDSLPPAWQASP